MRKRWVTQSYFLWMNVLLFDYWWQSRVSHFVSHMPSNDLFYPIWHTALPHLGFVVVSFLFFSAKELQNHSLRSWTMCTFIQWLIGHFYKCMVLYGFFPKIKEKIPKIQFQMHSNKTQNIPFMKMRLSSSRINNETNDFHWLLFVYPMAHAVRVQLLWQLFTLFFFCLYSFYFYNKITHWNAKKNTQSARYRHINFIDFVTATVRLLRTLWFTLDVRFFPYNQYKKTLILQVQWTLALVTRQESG